MDTYTPGRSKLWSNDIKRVLQSSSKLQNRSLTIRCSLISYQAHSSQLSNEYIRHTLGLTSSRSVVSSYEVYFKAVIIIISRLARFLHQHKLVVWVTASFLISPGFFSVFSPILKILWSGWSRFFLWFSNPPASFSNLLKTVPSAPTTNGITVTFIFHRYFSSLARSKYLSIFSISFIFTLCSAGTAKSPT